MYGKVFEDLFCSTLMDFGGDTAYVFIAMIVLSDEEGVIKHTVESLARMICKDAESVRVAVANLEAPDPKSNLKGHEGRRIVPLSQILEDETRGWLVVNKAHYRDKRDPNERRDYMREYMRKYRDSVNTSKQALAGVSSGETKLAHTDTDTKKNNTSPSVAAFARFWAAWPSSSRKGGKAACAELWRKGKLDAVADEVVAHVESMKRSEDWTKEGGRFIPAPAVYLRGRRWDGAEQAQPAGEVI